ncbi:MAG TPA: transglycosylase SLT domain-containing protein [Lysobacter sp.]|nr:transglycosylase SLT domain-containing protein [Lysobacter sp.]
MIGVGKSATAPLAAILAACLALPALAAADPTPPIAAAPDSAEPGVRNGRDIYRQFREGLAEPNCAPDASDRWRNHFAAAPRRLAAGRDDLLPLFGYVVDAMREADLPTEYALIPFVESGYKPGARSPLGPAGLWQMITVTARNHHIRIGNGYDGRLSPVDSTKAAVRYLKTLHGMFAGDWRLAAMAYNAGEYRIFGALRRGGQVARDAKPEQLPGLPAITHAYVRKLHALSCLLEQAEDDETWLQAIDRPVPELKAVTLPRDVRQLDTWAARTGQDSAQLRRLNPVLSGAKPRSGAMQLLVVSTPSNAVQALPDAGRGNPAAQMPSAAPVGSRRHTVVRGDNLSTIARRYGLGIGVLLDHNGLTRRSILRPRQVLYIDQPAPAGD